MIAEVRLNGKEHYTVEPPETATMQDLIDYVLNRVKKACKINNYKEHGTLKITDDSGEMVVDCKIRYIESKDKCIMVNCGKIPQR